MINIHIFFLTIVSIISFSLANEYPIMPENKIQGRLNIVNGYSTECVMHKFYTNTGWVQIEGEIGVKTNKIVFTIENLMKNKNKHISHDLLISYLLGEADSSQTGKVEEWLLLSDENKKTLNKFFVKKNRLDS